MGFVEGVVRPFLEEEEELGEVDGGEFELRRERREGGG